MTEDQRHRRRIDEVLDPEFITSVEAISIVELRRRRALCDDIDTELSYYRRLLHGRMDLLAFELRRRRGEEERTLIEALPEILAGSERAGARNSGRAISVAVPEFAGDGNRTVDRALSDDFLTRLPSIEESELSEVQRLLTVVEGEISDQRRHVYEVYELLQAELTRRYREGLADVDELLRG